MSKLNVIKVDIRPANKDKWARVQRSTSRISVWGNTKEDYEALEAIEQLRKKSFINVYKADVMPAVLAAMGLPADTKVSWSRTAGCSCGCSPGFIIKHDRSTDARDVFVTYTK